MDTEYIIRLVLRARDEMAGALAKARTELAGFASDADRARANVDELNKSITSLTTRLGNNKNRMQDFRTTLAQMRGEVRDTSGDFDHLGNSVSSVTGEMRTHSRASRDVDRDHVGLIRRMDNLGIAMQGAGVRIKSVGAEMRGLIIVGTIAFFQQLSTAAVGLAGNLVAVASSAAFAGAALGGALTAGAAQAIPTIGVLGASIQRLTDVFQALEYRQQAQQQQFVQQQQQDTRSANSANAVASARDSLAAASERVSEAERGVTQAQERVPLAQQALVLSQDRLNQARQDARRELEDLINSEREAELQARGASLTLEEAQRALREALQSGDDLRIRQARLRIDEARLGREEATQNLQRARADSEEARRRGIENSRQVEEARRSVAEAQRGVRQAVEGVSDAQRGVTEAVRSVAQAQRAVENARRSNAQAEEQGVTAARNLQFFLDQQLSQSERRLYQTLTRISDAYYGVFRQRITDPVIDSFNVVATQIADLFTDERVLGPLETLAEAIGEAIEQVGGELFSDESVAQWGRITEAAAENLPLLADIIVALSDIFAAIAEGAGPTLHDLLGDVADLTEEFSEFLDDALRTGDLTGFFEEGRTHLEAWAGLLGGIVDLFIAISDPDGRGGAADSGLRIINRITEGLHGWADELRENGEAVRAFFAESEEVLGQIWRVVEALAQAIFRLFDPETVETFANILVEVVIPALEGIIQAVGEIAEVIEAIFGLPGVAQVTIWVATLLGAFRASTLIFGMLGTGVRLIAQITGIGASIGRMLGTLNAGLTALGRGAGLGGAIGAMRTYAAQTNAAAAAQERLTLAQGGTVLGARGRQVPVRGPGGTVAAGAPRGTQVPPAATGGNVVGTAGGALTGGAGVAGALRAGAVGAARFVAPIAATVALVEFIASNGNLFERAGNVLNTFTFGLTGKFKTAEDDRAEQVRDMAKALDEATKAGDLDRVEDLRKEIGLLADDARAFGSEEMAQQWDEMGQKADELVEALKPLARHMDDLKRNQIAVTDILDPKAVGQLLGNFESMRNGAIFNLRNLREFMRNNNALILAGIDQDSDAWGEAMATNFKRGIDGVKELMDSGNISVDRGMKEIARITRQQMRFMRDNMGDLSADAKQQLANNFRNARLAVETQAGGIEEATGKTLQRIKTLMRQELEIYGLSPAQARRLARNRARGNDLDQFNRNEGGSQGGQDLRGAAGGAFFIGNRGERGRDGGAFVNGVPVGRGELLVANYAQQRQIDAALYGQFGYGIADLTRKVRGAHAGELGGGWAGGFGPIVPVPGFPGESAARSVLDEIRYYTSRFGLRLTDAYGQGHQSPGHTVYGTAADLAGPDRRMDAAVRALVRAGYKVLYDGRFGSTAWPGHGPSTVAGSNAHIHVEFGSKPGNLPGAVGAVANLIGPLGVRGAAGAGALGGIAQATVEGVRAAANNMIRAAAEDLGIEGSEAGAGAKGALSRGQALSLIARAMAIAGVPQGLRGSWAQMAIARAIQESGLDPDIPQAVVDVNTGVDPAVGIMQMIGSTFRAYALPGMDSRTNPLHQFVASFRYMLDRYGHGDWMAALRAMIGRNAANIGYQVGGAVPGYGGGDRWPILTEGGEHIWSKEEVQAAGGHGAMFAMRRMLGGGKQSGAPGRFDVGGANMAYGQGQIVPANLQYELPTLDILRVAGIIREFRRLNKTLQSLTRKSEESLAHFTNRFIQEADNFVREGGLFDQMAGALERRAGRRELRTLQRQFDRRGGKIVQVLTDEQVNARQGRDAELNEGDLRKLREQVKRFIRAETQRINRITGRIAALRQDGVTDDEREEIQRLRRQRNTLRGQRRQARDRSQELAQAIAEAIQAQYEAQINAINAAADQVNRAASARIGALDRRERILGLLGRGGQADFGGRQAALADQIAGLRDVANRFRAVGANDQAAELEEQIANLYTQIQEISIQAFQATIERINGTAQRRLSRLDTASTAIGLGIQGLATAGLANQGSVFAMRGAILSNQRNDLAAQIRVAELQGNTGAVHELTQAVVDLDVQIAQNTEAFRQYRIDQINGRAQFVTGTAGAAQGAVNALTALAGTGTATGVLASLMQTAIGALRTQGVGLRGELARILGIGSVGELTTPAQVQAFVARILPLVSRLPDELRTTAEGLVSAILQNTEELANNTDQLQDLTGANGQSFSSTLWQMFRVAAFSGNGQALPPWIPRFAGGGRMPWTGPAILEEGEIVVNPALGQTYGEDHTHVHLHAVEGEPDFRHAFEVAEFLRTSRRAT